MWAKLDDGAPDHPKFAAAGAAIGRDGATIAFGFYGRGLCYTNKHLTDGFLPLGVVKTWSDRAEKIAAALVGAALWEDASGGYRIHDFHDHNPHADEVRAKREFDRLRKENKRREELGLPPIPLRTRPGSAADSAKIPRGIRVDGSADSAEIPESRAGAGARPPARVPSDPDPDPVRSSLPLTPSQGTGNQVISGGCAYCGAGEADLGEALRPNTLTQPDGTTLTVAACAMCRAATRGHAFLSLDDARAWLHRAYWTSNRKRWIEHRAIAFGGQPPADLQDPRERPPTPWDQVLERLAITLESRTLHEWFRPLTFVADEGDSLTVRVASPVAQRYIERNYAAALDVACGQVRPGLTVRFVVNGSATNGPAPAVDDITDDDLEAASGRGS